MNNLEKYNLKLIDNNQYKQDRENLYSQKETLNNMIKDLNKQIKNIDTQFDSKRLGHKKMRELVLGLFDQYAEK